MKCRLLNGTSLFVLSVHLGAGVVVMDVGGAQAQTTIRAGSTITTPVSLTGSQTLAVEATGTLLTANAAITQSGAATAVRVDNYGTIRATGLASRAFDTSGGSTVRRITINNFATGLIQSDNNDAIRINTNVTSGSVTITNSGTILAAAPTNPSTTPSQALDLRVMNTAGVELTIINLAGGVIRAMNDDAIRPGLNATIDNAGTIESFGANTSDGINDAADAIDVGRRSGVQITNRAGGVISGARRGITADRDTFTTVTNEAGGRIIGSNGSGVGLDGSGKVINYGLISGDYAGAGNIFDSNGNASLNGDGDGVAIDGLATVINYGTIRGTGAGGVDSGGRPNGADGITAGGGSIDNKAGAVISGGNQGILIDDGAGGSAVGATIITNAGTITGQSGAAITLVGDFDDRITNSGTITGGGLNPVAVSLGGGNDTLTLVTGSSTTGRIDGGTGTDGLVLAGAGTGTLNLVTTPISNFETLVKQDSGSWRLDGGSASFTGGAVIQAGRLSVNGDLSGSPVTVMSGAELGGNGTVGTTTVNSGGTLAPGNSIGTLTVAGALVLAPGSTYAVEIAGNGTSDRIVVTGSATVTGSNVTIAALDPQASYQRGQRYTILAAGGGVVGSFAGVTTQSAFLDLSLNPATGTVDLAVQVKNGPPVDPADPGTPPGTSPGPAAPAVFQTVAQTRNQYATALGLNSLPQAGATLAFYNGLLMLDAVTARRAFDVLSGEIHASAKTARVEESSILRSTSIDRLRSAFGSVGAAPMVTMNYGFTADLAPAVKGPMPKLASAERFAVWGQGYGAWSRSDGDRNASKLTRSTGGLVIGADLAMLDTMRIGVLAGYSHSEFKASDRLSSGESDNYHLGVYGGGQWGALGLRTGASYTWHDVETSRQVAFAGFGNSLRSDYNAGTAQVFGELGYRFDVGQVAFEPFAGLAYVDLRTDGFNETGGIAALSARSDDTNVGYSTLGLRASTAFALSGMDLTLRGGLAWRHALGDVDPQATLAFAGSTPFAVTGVPIATNAALIEAGLGLGISKSVKLGVSYTGQLAQDAQDHAFKASLAVKF